MKVQRIQEGGCTNPRLPSGKKDPLRLPVRAVVVAIVVALVAAIVATAIALRFL